MTNPYYNPNTLTAHTVAQADAINTELQKIKAAFEKLPAPTAIGAGGGSPNYTHYAYSDSADGTANFTTGAANGRSYVGIAANQPSATPSIFPADYTWTRLRGTDGAGGTYTEFRYIRSLAPPAAPTGNVPAGSSTTQPSGTDPLWMTSASRNGEGALQSAWTPWERLTPYPSPQPYSAGTTYYEGMQTTYQGGTYLMQAASSVGNAPSGTAQDNAFWRVIAAPGAAGAPASAPPAFSQTINLTSSSTGVNLRTLADNAGYTGQSNATITFQVGSGVTITGAPGGGIAVDTGTWPTGYTISLTFIIKNGGIVNGGGGYGGRGGSSNAGAVGSAGGDGIYQRVNLTQVTVESGGIMRAGGGGGAGGSGSSGFTGSEIYGGAGGGGGGGAPNGPGGTPGSTLNSDQQATAGGTGTTSSGGAGGAGLSEGGQTGTAGGAGGNYALAGAASGAVGGGAAGYAVRRNGFTSPLTNNGLVTGTVG